MAISDQEQGPSPSDRAGETPEDPALVATQSADDARDDPLDFDSALLELAAAPAVSLPGRRALRPEPGTLIADSYRIERRLGEGGMGIVYLARDLELDRPVAVKLQSRPAASNDVARLQREARAMARLSHPNVVVVHEVGTHDGHLFIAMEYVEGGTAREWMQSKPEWAAVIEVLAGAGRGLAAAHEVGIVHRDFKPENVMIGRDGRPRVADFGLARDGASATGRAVELAPIGDRRLTATGAVLGTPAYMSPEQFAGHEVGPASDQFSFCVVAYEALFGRRPFRGRTTAELAASVTEGEVRGPPPRSGVPAALTRAVLTGLRADPTERHTSMAALVEALEGVVRARRRRVWLGVAAGVGVVALGLGYRGALALRPGPCEAVAEALGGAWDDARREAVATAVPDAAVQAIDAWASAWIEERRTACEETNVRGERSDFELGLRMACLDRHAARLDGFTAGLAETENADIGAERVDDMLPRLEDCRDVNTLDKHYNRFDRESERDSTAEDRAHLEALRLLSRANTRHLMYRDGAEELVAEAEAIMEQYGLHELDDTALALRADLAVRTGDRAAADALRMRSAEAAVATGDDALAADAIRLRADAALDAGDLSAARTHLQYFDLFVQRVAADDIRKAMEVKATVTRGNLALAQGKTEEAIGHFEQVMAAPDLQDPYDVRMGLGSAYLRVGRVADAVEQFEGALAERRAKGITDDPELAGALVNLANARMELGQLDAAVEDLRTAHGILERAGGDQRNLIGIVLGNWGLAERHRGDLERARELQEESLRVRTEALGEAHPLRAFATDELGELARLQRDWDAAQRWFEQSIALRRAAFGDEHPGVAASLTALGRVHLDRGAPKEAREVLTEARRILTATEQQDAEMIADVDALLERAI